MRSFFRKNIEILWFLGFPVVGFIYFATQHINLDYRIIHVALDDSIPFYPVFIIPYILWYIYIPLPMIYMFFFKRQHFTKQAIALFSGALLGCACFLIYPSAIDMRPTVEGNGFLNFCCRLIFENDNPVNVLPSLHCYEAVSIHMTTFTFGPLKNKPVLRIISFIAMALICASTVFVKQHSIVDLIVGCLLAVLICIIVEFVYKEKGKRNDN